MSIKEELKSTIKQATQEKDTMTQELVVMVNLGRSHHSITQEAFLKLAAAECSLDLILWDLEYFESDEFKYESEEEVLYMIHRKIIDLTDMMLSKMTATAGLAMLMEVEGLKGAICALRSVVGLKGAEYI